MDLVIETSLDGSSNSWAPVGTIPVGEIVDVFAVPETAGAAVRARSAGGGYWEAMHGDMAGWFEVRVDGPKPRGGKGRHHYRLYCLLDYDAKEVDKPLLVIVAGLDKPFRTKLSATDYARVSRLGEEFLARNPRSLN
jgi:hypothetical protein